MAWFKKSRKPREATPGKASKIPEGLWVKCPGCAQALFNKDLATNQHVCPKCAHHFRIGARDRLRTLFDGDWVEYDANLVSTDPLRFVDTKPYVDRLRTTIAATGEHDAVVVATGSLDGHRTVIAAMEYSFIGGSMGVVVGEKITRGIERAIAERLPVIIVSCSGGARMMEGALSLMQMAKISAALARLDRAQTALHLGVDGSDHGRCDGELCDVGRLEHCRAESAHRLRRTARDRADHPSEAAGRISAQRIPSRARHD